jgi:hypothetical protein
MAAPERPGVAIGVPVVVDICTGYTAAAMQQLARSIFRLVGSSFRTELSASTRCG